MGRLRGKGLRVLKVDEGVQPKGYKNRYAQGIDSNFLGINGYACGMELLKIGTPNILWDTGVSA